MKPYGLRILIAALCLMCPASFVLAQSQPATLSGTTAAPGKTVEAPNPSPTPATPPGNTGGPGKPGEAPSASPTLDKVGQVLLVFLVLSVVFESALTPIFNWRYFLLNFENRGLKTPITVILALLVFWGYGLDIIRDLLNALGYNANKSFGGQLLTALLIAGGSSGVLGIFAKLGIREKPNERQQRVETVRDLENERKEAERKAKEEAAKAEEGTKPGEFRNAGR